MGTCMSVCYSDGDESDCCKKDHHEEEQKDEQVETKEDNHEGNNKEDFEEKLETQTEQAHQVEQVVVYKVVYDHVEYDVASLLEKYETTTRDIQESICAIFGVMLAYVKSKKVFDTTFDFCGWLPRRQHAKLESYKSLVTNLDGLVASFGVSTLELKALKMVAYSFHKRYFEGLAEAFKEDLVCIRVACAGLDCRFVCHFDQHKLDRILEDNTKWFLDQAKTSHLKS